jgi:imidazole glycerol phosphate synthase glutamine amidotransferase subunit
MPAQPVIVVSTGSANLASVFAGLRRLGATPQLCDAPAQITAASHVVLPGVGAFGAAMERLSAQRYVEPLVARLKAGRPTFCVCLGLQLLGEQSEETPGVRGLGLIPGGVQRFPAHVRVPQFGWNKLNAGPDCTLLQTGYAYFANSYRFVAPAPGWAVALAEHGGLFVAACERGAVLGCQFHPELSGPWGQALLARWLATTDAGGAAC